jgi:hypothetical protein
MNEVTSVLTAMSENEKVKLESCLSGLGSVAASLKAVIDYGMQQLRESAIKPRVNPWVDAFLSVNHQLSEASFHVLKGTACYCYFSQELFFLFILVLKPKDKNMLSKVHGCKHLGNTFTKQHCLK